MIYHWGVSLSKHALLNAHKPWITAGFVTVYFSVSMVNKNFMQPFLRSTKLLCYTRAWTKLHKLSWTESLVLMMSLFMAALTWSELNYCAWFDGTVCEVACTCPSWSAVTVIGVELDSKGYPSCQLSLKHTCRFEILHICSFNSNFRYMASRTYTYTRILQWSPR